MRARLPQLRTAALGTALGMALFAWLLRDTGVAPVLGLLHGAGWGMAAVVLFHLTQIASAAAAWRAVAGTEAPRPSLWDYAVLRWLREGINGLLPVAQVGGNVAAIRVLRRRGQTLARAAAGCIADTTVEFTTEVGFILCGLVILLLLVQDRRAITAAVAGLVLAAAAAMGLALAQRLGMARWIEGALLRMGAGWTDDATGLHGTLMGLYGDRGALARAAGWHGLAWGLGAAEVWLAMRAIGTPVPLGPALVIESLGQAMRGAAFAVPAGIGVQEGGFVAVCSLFGLPAEAAIALSLVKRVREVALGLPAILAWPWLGRGTPEAAPLGDAAG